MLTTSYEKFENDHPLVRFSFYLWGRVNALINIRTEILQCLDKTFAEDFIDYESLSRAETLTWLWILGAYEVVRTMCQADVCFSRETSVKLHTLKRELEVVRMPAAKMEKKKRGSSIISVTSNRSAVGIDIKNKDLLVGDPLEDHLARELLNNFYTVFSSFREEDILSSHESVYGNKNK